MLSRDKNAGGKCLTTTTAQTTTRQDVVVNAAVALDEHSAHHTWRNVRSPVRQFGSGNGE
jgi:hypothetical protein